MNTAIMAVKTDSLVKNNLRVSPLAAGNHGWPEAFAGHLSGQGLSERTVQAYGQDVRSFATWFESENGQPFSPELLTGVDLRGYRQWAVDGRHMAPRTWNRRRIALGIFCHWAQETGALNYDPFQGVEEWKEEELPPRWLDKCEFSKFMRQVEHMVNGARSEYGRRQALRDQAMVALMMYAGLREGELVALNVEDIQISERKGKVTIWRGKGDKKREIPLNGEARRAVSLWIMDNQARANMTGVLFIGKSGKRLTTRAVQRRVAEIGRMCGLVVTPHDLRHTFAKRALDAGAALTVVSKLLGHSRLQTTARYVQPGWGDFEQAVENI